MSCHIIKAGLMEEQKHIKDYIVDYLLEENAKKSIDPVLAESVCIYFECLRTKK